MDYRGIGMKSPKCKILNHKGYDVAIIQFEERMEVLSSAVYNGGDAKTDTVFIMQVPKNFMHDNPASYAEDACRDMNLPKDSIGFMTAAEVKYVFSYKTEEFEGSEAFAAVTAGLSNQVIAGEVLKDWERRSKLSGRRGNALTAGTINIVGVSSTPLTQAAKVNIMIAMTEAKTAALASFDYKETGTTSDAIAIISPQGEPREPYSGTGTPLGIAMSRAVKHSVRESLTKRGDNTHGNYLDILAEAGIYKDILIRLILDYLNLDENDFVDLGEILDELTDNEDMALLTQFAVSADLIFKRISGEISMDEQSMLDNTSKEISSCLKRRIYGFVAEGTDINVQSSIYPDSLPLTEQAGSTLNGIIEGLAEGVSILKIT